MPLPGWHRSTRGRDSPRPWRCGHHVRSGHKAGALRGMFSPLPRWGRNRAQGGDEYRPWIHEREQSGIINAFRDHAVKILLRITVGILENAVVNAHRQGSDVAGDRRDFDARFESSDVYRLKAAPARAGDVDAAGINFGEGQQVI